MNEMEVKFLLKDLPALHQKLLALGVGVEQARVLEINLRFDTPGREMERAHRVLRLRRDTAVRLTYKDPAVPGAEVSTRREIEFEASDFEAARQFLEALGYEVSVIYEKYRAVYTLEGCHVALDELPFGDFCEIEGPDADGIRRAASRLALNWQARINDSYMSLFNRLRQSAGLAAANLSFAEVQHKYSPEAFGVQAGD